MERPLISVLMTSYNREKYIAEAIESVINSTYKNWELIIVDDCSMDKTVDIARSYEEKDMRIKVYENKKNLGDYPNRNKAASYANGTYLKYLDADDLLYSHGLEILVEMMEQFPDTGLGLCSFLADPESIYPIRLTPEEAYYRHYFTKQKLFNKSPLSAIIKKTAFFGVGGFANMRMVGDFEMWHKLALEYPLVLMPHGLVWYRIHENQEMKDYFKFINVYLEVSKSYIQDEKCPLKREQKEKLLKMIRKEERKRKIKKILFKND